MEVSIEYFDRLPDEVIQLIFSCISDCKSLVRCMSVSKAFLQQSVSVSCLSIACPGRFSSYDERLHKVYSMVKPFKNLQSLVVRVGQPKEEPPSWARCMRYAEIGGSVEKFVFMAAKSGNFSVLDSTLMGVDSSTYSGEESDGDGDGNGILVPETSTSAEDSVCGQEQTVCLKEESEKSLDSWIEVESDDESSHRLGVTSRRCCKPAKGYFCPKTFRPDACFLREPSQRKPLTDFSIRQVIAPSNDVLQRMLPVIHIAIVQGLNELRDSLPAFIAQFSKLTRLLLVDMVESITVYMREHHMQEIRALYCLSGQEVCHSGEGQQSVEPYISGARQNSYPSLHQAEDGELASRDDKGKGKLLVVEDEIPCAAKLGVLDQGSFSSQRFLADGCNYSSGKAGAAPFPSFADPGPGSCEASKKISLRDVHVTNGALSPGSSSWYTSEEYVDTENKHPTEMRGDGADEVFQCRYKGGGAGHIEGSSVDHLSDREEGYRWKGCRLSRDAKANWSSGHPSKRSLSVDCTKLRECTRNPRFRLVDNLIVLDSSTGEARHAQSCSNTTAEIGTITGGSDVCCEGESICESYPDAADACMNECHETTSLSVERHVEIDSWGQLWRERVQKLRESLREVPGQVDYEESRRERSRELLRPRHQDMEKDALAFDYTFWRAEQVASCNYALSDLSMCIATHGARPLRDSDKEILSYAALAGPLLVATVTHVNKHYTCHNL